MTGCPDTVWSGDELDWVKPRHGRLYLRGVGARYLTGHPFDDGFQRILREYKPPRAAVALILPCSYGKPYSQSYIHYLIRRAIARHIANGDVHEIIVTNAGVVPRELDEHWPYTAYDWNPAHETPEIRECYKKVLAQRLQAYIQKHRNHYKAWAAYLRWDSDSWAALQEAAKRLGMDIPNLAPKNTPQEEVREAGLGLGYDKDPDITLITPTSLEALAKGITKIIQALGHGNQGGPVA